MPHQVLAHLSPTSSDNSTTAVPQVAPHLKARADLPEGKHKLELLPRCRVASGLHEVILKIKSREFHQAGRESTSTKIHSLQNAK